MVARSFLIALAIVTVGAVLVAFDPRMMATYREVAPTASWLITLCEWVRAVLDPPIVLAPLLLYALLNRVQRLQRFLVLAGTMLTQALVVDLLKMLFGRPRPADVPDIVLFLGPGYQGSLGFPSGHATAAYALAALLSAWHPGGNSLFHAAAAFVAWTRLHLNRHFVGDLFFGGWLGYWIAQAFLNLTRDRGKPSAHPGEADENPQ